MGALSHSPPPRRGAPPIQQDDVSAFWITVFVVAAIVGSLLGGALAFGALDILPTRPTFRIGGTF